MPIVSSSYTIDTHAQTNGAHWVQESHMDSNGRVHSFLYKQPPGLGTTEATTRMNARVTELNELLADMEAEGLLGA